MNDRILSRLKDEYAEAVVSLKYDTSSQHRSELTIRQIIL